MNGMDFKGQMRRQGRDSWKTIMMKPPGMQYGEPEGVRRRTPCLRVPTGTLQTPCNGEKCELGECSAEEITVATVVRHQTGVINKSPKNDPVFFAW